MGWEAAVSKTVGSVLFWTPRVAGILFILFLSLFALDVFDMGLDFRGTLLALLMHLIPSIALAVALALAWKWKWEWVGALAFFEWAIWYIASARGFDWSVYALIAGIPALIGLLFLMGWLWRGKIHLVGLETKA